MTQNSFIGMLGNTGTVINIKGIQDSVLDCCADLELRMLVKLHNSHLFHPALLHYLESSLYSSLVWLVPCNCPTFYSSLWWHEAFILWGPFPPPLVSTTQLAQFSHSNHYHTLPQFPCNLSWVTPPFSIPFHSFPSQFNYQFWYLDNKHPLIKFPLSLLRLLSTCAFPFHFSNLPCFFYLLGNSQAINISKFVHIDIGKRMTPFSRFQYFPEAYAKLTVS